MAKSILELAKHGDPQAIAILINRSLEPRGITAQASLERDCLQLVLQSSQTLNQKAVVSLIQRGMLSLGIKSIKKVDICARKSGSDFIGWRTELNLDLSSYKDAGSVPSLDISEPLIISQPTSSAQAIATDKPQQGIVLMQKLSQLKHVSQEYQDIIIRFIDERYGTVKCLSTLTELIQAINKSSFSFSSVAANPNLRTLLDTIAESSTTDKNGDQVITNVSILQPGQQWQKVKIRLVTKIFFEPESYVPSEENEKPTNGQSEVITLDVLESIEEIPTPSIAASSLISREPEPTETPIIQVSETQTQTQEESIEDLTEPLIIRVSETQPQIQEESVEDLFAAFESSGSEQTKPEREPQSAISNQLHHQLPIVEAQRPTMLDDLADMINDDDEPTEVLGSSALQSSANDQPQQDSDTLTLESLDDLVNSVRSQGSNSEGETDSMTLDDFSLSMWD